MIEILTKIGAKITIIVVENREPYYFIIICKCKEAPSSLFSYQMLVSTLTTDERPIYYKVYGSHPLVMDKNKPSIPNIIVRYWKLCSHTSLKKRPKFKKKFILHHDNMCPHTSSKTTVFLTKHGIEVKGHHPYSPNLAPMPFLALSMPEIHSLGIEIRHQWSSCCSGKFLLQFYWFEWVCQNVGEMEGDMGQMYRVTRTLFWKNSIAE